MIGLVLWSNIILLMPEVEPDQIKDNLFDEDSITIGMELRTKRITLPEMIVLCKCMYKFPKFSTTSLTTSHKNIGTCFKFRFVGICPPAEIYSGIIFSN